MPRFPRIKDTEDKFDREGNKVCRNCSELVSENRRHYCSEKCMDEFNRNNSWFWIRKDVLKRDRYTCCICKTRLRKRELDVDHIIPVRLGWNVFDKDNLRTLCKECHRAKSRLDKEALGK